MRVNAIAMGWTLTDSEDKGQSAEKGRGWLAAADAAAPIGRLLRPDDLAATIGHLLSPAATMITGAIVDVCPDFTNGCRRPTAEGLPERPGRHVSGGYHPDAR